MLPIRRHQLRSLATPPRNSFFLSPLLGRVVEISERYSMYLEHIDVYVSLFSLGTLGFNGLLLRRHLPGTFKRQLA